MKRWALFLVLWGLSRSVWQRTFSAIRIDCAPHLSPKASRRKVGNAVERHMANGSHDHACPVWIGRIERDDEKYSLLRQRD